MMITADTLRKAKSAEEQARIAVSEEMPNGEFIFIGIELAPNVAYDDFIFFRVCAKLSTVTEKQIRDIKEKTRFETVKEIKKGIYSTDFKMAIR